MCIWALWEITEEAGNFIFDPSDTLNIHIQQDNISVSQQKMHTLFYYVKGISAKANGKMVYQI
jgi:hypothetical protein